MPQITAPPPPPLEQRIHRTAVADVRREAGIRRRGARLPAGSTAFSLRHTWQTLADPLALLLDHHRRYGPVFTIRTLHEPIVWAISAETNHQILVSEFDAFSWREGRFRDLAPILGDGMLNIDGRYHREMRKLMLPAFHHEQVAAVADVMVEEGVRAAERLQPGQELDVYGWTRELALRIALRGLLGMDAGDSRERPLAHAFEEALSFYGRPFPVQVLRGPGTPFAKAQRARVTMDRLVHAEIEERRAAGRAGEGVLALLLEATDADGRPLPAEAVRDQAVTLLFAGHDTTTATLTFLLYELGRSASARAELEAELDAVLPGGTPTAAQLDGKALPGLERALDETLRRYPPAWVGPRRTTRDVVLGGEHIPAGIGVQYSSWATHHLAELYEDPLAFRPDRFLPENVSKLPKGAYIPFGGGTRMCLGKRFGQYELRALAAVLLSRLRFEPDPAHPLRMTTTPTLGPVGGLRFRVRERA